MGDHCFVCGDANIATQRQAKSLYTKQAQLFKNFILSPDFLSSFNLRQQVFKDMKKNVQNSACSECLSFIKEVWDFQQQIEALKDDIKQVMDKTRLKINKSTEAKSDLLEVEKVEVESEEEIEMEEFEIDTDLIEPDIGESHIIDVLDPDFEDIADPPPPRKRKSVQVLRNTKDPQEEESGDSYTASDSDEDDEPPPTKKRQPAKSSTELLKNSQETNYQCPKCQKYLSNKKNLLIHQVTVCEMHISQKKLEKNNIVFKYCEHCPKRFAKMDDFKRHLNIHSTVKPFSCGKCEATFSLKVSLLNHEQSNCLDSEIVGCRSCKKILSTEKTRLIHEVVVCSLKVDEEELEKHNIKFKQCSSCPAKFASTNAFAKHLTIHSKTKPFSCKKCGKQFSTSSYTFEHEKSCVHVFKSSI